MQFHGLFLSSESQVFILLLILWWKNLKFFKGDQLHSFTKMPTHHESTHDKLLIQLLGNWLRGQPGRGGRQFPEPENNSVTAWHAHRLGHPRASLHTHCLEHSQAVCTLTGAGRCGVICTHSPRLCARPRVRSPIDSSSVCAVCLWAKLLS